MKLVSVEMACLLDVQNEIQAVCLDIGARTNNLNTYNSSIYFVQTSKKKSFQGLN